MNAWLITLLILSGDAGTDTDRPPVEADEVYTCDFQESSDQNFDRWPDDWTRRRGRGFPSYLPIEIAPDAEKSDNQYLQIQLDGGAAQVFSPPITVIPQFSYQLRCQLRTEKLKHNVVSVTVSFYDAEQQLIETYESALQRDLRDWTEIVIGPVTPAGDRVRTAVVSLHVRPGEHSDLEGTICLDDIWLGRLPKMAIEINGENGVFTDPHNVRITCSVSGFKNPRPQIDFELLDAFGVVLSKASQVMEGQPEINRLRSLRNIPLPHQQGFAGSTTWRPSLTEAGFYTARVSTATQAGSLATHEVNFVVMPPLPRQKSGEFGWSLNDGAKPLTIRQLPNLLNQTGVQWVKYPVWFGAKETKRAEEIAWFAERLSSFDIQMVGLIDEPPAEIRSVFGDLHPLPIATAFADKAVWYPALDPVMTRLSLKIHWWQLGRDDDTSFASYPDLTAKLNEIRQDLASFGQNINLGVPWKVIEERPRNTKLPWAFFSLIEEVPLTSEELKSYVADRAADQSKQWLILQPLKKQDYKLEVRARDLVLRMLAAKIAKVDAVFVPHPFHDEVGLMQADGSPGPLLLPWRTTSLLIGGGQYAGSIKLINGSENFVFVHDQHAVLVVWNERACTEKIYLGENVKQYDIWGRQKIPKSEDFGPNTIQEIEVGPMPTFITDVNPSIAKWRMGFQFDISGLASIFGREQIVTYQFQNTFPQGVSGQLKFHCPDDWKVDGVERQFKVGPGEWHRGVLRVQLGPDATSGQQPIQVDFDLYSDRPHNFSLFENLRVGLGDVLVELDTRLDAEGNLVVEQHLTNNTDKPVSFKCFLSIPGRRRERKQIFNAGRGRTTNVYVVPNGKELIGKMLWFRAEEIDGARVLNDHMVAHE